MTGSSSVRGIRERTCRLAFVVVALMLASCMQHAEGHGFARSVEDLAQTPRTDPVQYPVRAVWLAPRQSAPLDDPRLDGTLAYLRKIGTTHVAIGHEVSMPSMREPVLEWGDGDEELRTVLRRIHRAGLATMLLPRIESPDFFRPPYPFRADIVFADESESERFHDAMQKMLLHYAGIAQAEGVAIFGLGLEMKRSAKARPDRWRQTADGVRKVFDGKLTYSANWYDEWEQVAFWDALDYIGIGAYFELRSLPGQQDAEPVADIAARWRPVAERIAALSKRFERKVLFTEIGYTGYVDTVERPWEWAGKQDRDPPVPIDWQRQADAYAGLFRALGKADWLAGTFVWRIHPAVTADTEGWEYVLQGRPAADVLRAAYERR